MTNKEKENLKEHNLYALEMFESFKNKGGFEALREMDNLKELGKEDIKND